jgi:hypothetical protein
MLRFKFIGLVLLVGVLGSGMAQATVVGYTDQADFLAAISGLPGQQNQGFDAQTAGNLIPSGASAGNVTFTYGFGGFAIQVLNDYLTTSGSNYLGTDGDGIFLAGDAFTMTFSQAVNAVGLFVISGEIIYAGDFSLSTGAGSVMNSDLTDSTFGTLSDGGQVFFLGLADLDQAFTSATFASGLQGGDFLFNVDDIRTASATASVPEPSSILLVSMGMIGAGLLRKIRK